MIKFFRHIRKSLLEQNKTSKYFKYAIGEIILVVIGILIALQINNWNETNKLKKEEQEVLASLYKETENNNNTLIKAIEQNDWINNITLKLLDSIENGYDTFEKSDIAFSTFHNTFQTNTPVLDGILNNESKLITKQSHLISDLRILNALYANIKKQEFYLDDNWNTNLTQFVIKCGFDFRLDTKAGRKITLKQLNKCGYNKAQFKAIISLTKVLKESWVGSFKSTQKQSEIVLKKLDSLQ